MVFSPRVLIKIMKSNDYNIDDLINNESFQSYARSNRSIDKEHWENWLLENADKKKEFHQAVHFLNTISIKEINVIGRHKEEDLEKLIKTIYQLPEKRIISIHKYTRSFLQYAAIFIVALTIGFSISHFTEILKPTEVVAANIEKMNPKGQKSIIMLPDGSKVYLNSNSHLKYENDPIAGQRIIHLTGEAFFEVIKDEERPFVVYTNGIKTTAVGTSFNINAYDDNINSQVYLKTGKVEVQSENNFMHLSPGEGLNFNAADNKLGRVSLDGRKVLGWKSDLIIFDNAGLDEVVRTLENWYGVTINVVGKTNKKWRINGEFENEKLDNILKSLSFTSSFDYTIKDEITTLKFR